jgi:hypothetical protein
MLQMQDEERRRIARELHDSAGQSCAELAGRAGAFLYPLFEFVSWFRNGILGTLPFGNVNRFAGE